MVDGCGWFHVWHGPRLQVATACSRQGALPQCGTQGETGHLWPRGAGRTLDGCPLIIKDGNGKSPIHGL